MVWNHRVFKTVDCRGRESYGIHEVYYETKEDDASPCTLTVDPIEVVGESVMDLRWTLMKMLEALDKPVLTEEDLPKETGEKKRFGDTLPWDALGPENAP